MSSMSPAEIIERCNALSVEPVIDNGRLRLKANREEDITPELADLVRRNRSKLMRELGAQDTPTSLAEYLEDYADRLEQGRQYEGYVWTGWKELDNVLRGTGPGYLTIVAARPKMGKSSFARQWAAHIAQKADVLLFSFEMEGLEVAQGHVSQQSRVPLAKHTADLVRQIARTNPRIHIHDRGRDFVDIKRKIETFCLQFPNAGAIFVDQLSHMRAPKSVGFGLRETTGYNVRGLKSLAMDVGKPIILLHQIGREAEKRGENKRPTISDLKETGACEEDANQIVLLYRPAYYSGDEDDHTVEVNVAAHRGGPTGLVHFTWDPPITRFDLPLGGQPPKPPKPSSASKPPKRSGAQAAPARDWHDREDDYPEETYF